MHLHRLLIKSEFTEHFSFALGVQVSMCAFPTNCDISLGMFNVSWTYVLTPQWQVTPRIGIGPLIRLHDPTTWSLTFSMWLAVRISGGFCKKAC